MSMKQIKRYLTPAALVGAILLTFNLATAQVVVRQATTTNSAGTISEFGRDTLIIRSETSPEPLRYSYSKTTTYVDEAGNPVSIETVKSGLPVTVFYEKDGDRMVASKVVVRQKKTTAIDESGAAVTTVGTISEFSPDTIIVRSASAPEPIRYGYTKTTTYVDEAGNPVSIETVKSGLPVTVYYAKEGDRMIARKVVVRKSVPVAPAPAVVEKKTTTTTTTESK
jgi:hypothetical protein